MPPPKDEIANRLFAAIQENDLAVVDSLYSDDLETWHSFDNRTRNRTESLALIGHFGPGVGKRRYRLLDSISAASRIARRYELTISLTARPAEYKMNIAIFLTISDGQVSRIHEYIDSHDASEILAEVGRSTSLVNG